MPTNRTITETDGSMGPEVEYEPKSSYFFQVGSNVHMAEIDSHF
jgi:hypothetical protein